MTFNWVNSKQFEDNQKEKNETTNNKELEWPNNIVVS